MLLVTAMVEKLGVSLVGVARKRKVAAFASTISSERLEDRALMSAVMDTGAEAADVSVAKKSDSSTFDVSADLGDGLEGATSNVKIKKNGGVSASTAKFKDESGKTIGTLNFSKGKVDAEGNVTINVKGSVSVADPNDESETPALIKVKFKGTGEGTVDPEDLSEIVITVTVTSVGKNAEGILAVEDTFDVTFTAAEVASVAGKKSTPTFAGTYDVSVTDEDDNEVTTGQINVTQKGKKFEGTGDEDSAIGEFSGKISVDKKGNISVSKGKLEYTGENADGNPKTVNAKITKVKIDDATGEVTIVAQLADGLENVVGRNLIITATPA